MQIQILRAKIYNAVLTGAELEYEGSIRLDRVILDAVGLLPFEKVLVANMANGERFETYVIEGRRGSGVVELNGAAAHKGKPGDRVILMSFARMTAEEARGFRPSILHLEPGNRVPRSFGEQAVASAV